jgi:hypothetical protein
MRQPAEGTRLIGLNRIRRKNKGGNSGHAHSTERADRLCQPIGYAIRGESFTQPCAPIDEDVSSDVSAIGRRFAFHGSPI